ncbi:hypothetical protein PR003_g31363 [Phytophthora rubi]|uniref:Uncharacterized protein n=1 Tax=Phytophthora rubi TaxID=129364 RepID=A0A6A4BCE3_9STRA|nr:hypothetical protein PR003_g31363 [Phytophthora rubi]
MPGAERHSGARKWRACSHRAPKKQTKGDGRAAKGQYGTYSWPMEKLMDHYGNDAAERNARKQAASGSVVAASELEHGKLRLASSKRRRGWWRRPISSMASCGWPAARFVGVGGVHGVGGGANDCSALVLHATAASRLVAASELEHGKLRLASSKRRRARVTEDGGGVRAADRMLQLPSSKRCPARVTEDGGGVRAADCMLQLPSSKGCPAAWRWLVAASAPRMATCRCRAGGS